MFNSSKLSDSPSYFKTNLTNIRDETINDTSRNILFPKITSTPLNSIFATPPKNKIMTPRRYSLSEVATPPRHNRREYVRSTTSKYQPGPLLASTKFNLSVSTFEDAKSPGLVNRIVQYNEETERQKEQRRPVTHQEKYGSVGLFPVVHLFKNKLPTLQKKPRHVTVRVASPDYVKHTPEYNRKLLEGLVNPTGGNHTLLNSRHSGNSTSTRSVLDALKEISRKRIHANEELELRKDAGKRLRTDNDDHVDSSKRLRDESLLQENTSPSKPVSKKICMYDEYAASRSSMDFAFKRTESTQPKRKSISISTLTENPKQTKEIKLQNAETQTLEEVSSIGNTSTNKTTDEDASKEDLENKQDENVGLNDEVFDEGTLSVVRENRLASFIGTLIGKDPVLERSYKDLCRDEVDEVEPETEATTTNAGKPLVGILSPAQKSTKKIEKHVTFKIPESTSQNIETSAATSTEHSVGKATEKQEQKVLPQSSVASKGDGISIRHGGLLFHGDSSGSSQVPCTSATFVNANTPSSIPFTPKSLSADAPKTIPSFNFGNKPAISSPSSTLTASPPKMGGFKFDLSKPAASAVDSKVVSSSTTPNVTLTAQPTNTTPAQFSFGPKTSNTFGTSIPALNSTVSTFTSAVETTTAGSTVTASIPPITSVLSAPQNQTFAVSSTASNKPTFAFGTSSSPPNSSFNFGAKSEPSTTSSSFGTLFGATSINTITTSATTSFNTSTSVANKDLITSSTATNSFGTTSTVPAFGNANNSFQLPKTENAGFNNSSTATNTSAFGGQNTVSFGTATTTSSGFGNVSSFGNNTGPGFGTTGFGSTTASGFGTTTTPAFGTTTTPTPGFGTTTTPAFGTTATPTPAFGATTTPTPAFGTTTTPTPAFGTTTTPTPGFGTTTTPPPAFGNTTTPNSAFGTNPTPASPFGGATNTGFATATTGFGSTPSGFGVATTTSSNFGSTGSNVFGVTTTSSGFGGTFTSPANLNSPFGSNTSVNSNFGVSTTSAGGFGTSNTTKSNTAGFGSTTSFNFGPTTTTASTGFGGSTTTTQGFGTTTAPAFGTTPGSIFASTNVPSFGTTGSSFSEAPFGAATTSTPAFGTTTTTPSFSFGGNNKHFGGGANTAFGAPTTTTNSVFGTTQSPFGSGMPTTSTSALPFAFTAKVTTSSTFPSTNTSTTSFGNNFGQTNSAFGTQNSGFGTQNKAPAFGNNATPAFGSSVPTQGFGTSAQPSQPFGSSGSVFNKPQAAPQNAFNSSQFNFNQQQNAAPNQAGVFTFGAGANEKPGGFNFSGAASGETPKKFDFTGGSTAAPAFGTAFGTTPAVPAFGAAPATGGFSIGSGPRPRKQVTAKRRT
ncbi:mucin-5AC [Diabrotica virgifera virgifera]|uniref:Mucin-5AC-like n=1 Tax=Diabrotica virgifera virgifera TaxID=50390 RepID=A0A6P7FJX6_DIAVI|nr:mucin-5AC [Diabrotica virgifera virgifera]